MRKRSGGAVHPNIMLDRLVPLSLLVLEYPDNKAEDVEAVCEKMLENFARWKADAQYRRLKELRRSPSGAYRAPIVDEETR